MTTKLELEADGLTFKLYRKDDDIALEIPDADFNEPNWLSASTAKILGIFLIALAEEIKS